MNLLLINPSQEKVYGKKMMPAYPPLGLLHIGTVLKNEGHGVRLLDIDTEKIDEKKFENIFRNFNPDAVGITGVTPTFKNALKWARLSKKIRNVPVIMGGVHATIAPDETIGCDSVDIIVVGEGELTAKELFNRLQSPGSDLGDIKGIYFKRDKAVVANEKRPLIEDLDSIPFPDRAMFKKAHAFMPPDAVHLPVATIMTSRGCPGDCTFCCTKQIFSKKFRTRSTKNMVEEVERLVNKEGIKEIHIADDTFTIIKKRALEFCGEIKKKNLNVGFQFMNGLRADFVDRDILLALRSIGMKTVGFGVESGNKNILKNIKKNIPAHITRKAFRLSRELGFETWAFLVFGLPGETDRTIRETIEFTKELDPDFAKFLILEPYPGSEVHAELKKANLILSTDYDDYGLYTKPVHRLPGLEPEKMVYWQKRAFREFYLRPRKILFHLGRIIKIRSWVQLRLLVNDILFAVYCMFKRDEK